MYVLWLALAYRYHLVDGVNVGAHEAGRYLELSLGGTAERAKASSPVERAQSCASGGTFRCRSQKSRIAR